MVVRPRIVKHELPVFPELCDALVISAGDTLADGRYGDRVRNEVIVVRIVLIASFEYPDSERKNHIYPSIRKFTEQFTTFPSIGVLAGENRLVNLI